MAEDRRTFLKKASFRFALLPFIYYVVAFAILNFWFPLSYYLINYSYPRWYPISGHLLMAAIVTGITVALARTLHRPQSRLGRALIVGAITFVCVAVFAIACSGAGLSWAWGWLSRLHFFFVEWEFLRFIGECGPLLATAAAVYAYIDSGISQQPSDYLAKPGP